VANLACLLMRRRKINLVMLCVALVGVFMAGALWRVKVGVRVTREAVLAGLAPKDFSIALQSAHSVSTPNGDPFEWMHYSGVKKTAVSGYSARDGYHIRLSVWAGDRNAAAECAEQWQQSVVQEWTAGTLLRKKDGQGAGVWSSDLAVASRIGVVRTAELLSNPEPTPKR
jgi:hypothetical protein